MHDVDVAAQMLGARGQAGAPRSLHDPQRDPKVPRSFGWPARPTTHGEWAHRDASVAKTVDQHVGVPGNAREPGNRWCGIDADAHHASLSHLSRRGPDAREASKFRRIT
jgi:hypothetical protein